MNTRSKRSLDIPDSSHVYPLRRQIEDNVNSGLSQRVHTDQISKEITLSLLQEGFRTLSEGIWWRILPLEESYDDIAVGMGIDWEDLLPLLINNGLLYTNKQRTDNKILISHNSWQSFTSLQS